MDVYAFADTFLQPYQRKGQEIIPTYCPYCHGGDHKDKYTFALNVDRQVFKCQRGSCGRQGHFTQLCRDFGVQADQSMTLEPFRKEKHYASPRGEGSPLAKQAEEYLKLRGISKQTLETCGVRSDADGNIQFNYLDASGTHVFTKYRPSHEVQKGTGERKAWRDKDTKPVLYLMHLCSPEKPLIIVEGEIDCLSLVECGIDNAVSVPSGTQDLTFLDTCFDWLQQFHSITLFVDNDAPGQELAAKLISRLGECRISTVPLELYRGCKDANELLYRHGKDAVIEAVAGAKLVPVAGLLELADVKPLDLESIERVSSGIKALDDILGGFMAGQLTVWTGKRGEGKSTLLGQMMIEAVESGVKVCAYSGELQATYFQYCIDLQCAGPKYVMYRKDPLRDTQAAYVTKGMRDRIHDWYRGRFYIYDNLIVQSNEVENVMNVFTYAVKRYNCKVFMVDNLMTLQNDGDDRSFYRKQSVFTGQLVDFAKKYNVHVHLVAHPRKTDRDLGNDDIAGSGDITNRADNVITVSRLSEAERAQNGADSVLRVIKNRFYGKAGEIGLNFCTTSRRFYLPSTGNTRQYGWLDGEPVYTEIGETEELPW